MKITQQEAAYKIFATKGKVFTVEFTKKDGSHRVMNARLGVKKHLKGGELAYNPADYELIGCYDMQSGGYRMINIKTMLVLKVEGKEYEVINEEQ